MSRPLTFFALLLGLTAAGAAADIPTQPNRARAKAANAAKQILSEKHFQKAFAMLDLQLRRAPRATPVFAQPRNSKQPAPK